MAVSMGDTVINRNMPFVWEGGKLPWHCTNRSKLRITCPEKFRIYADRVEQNVPIWREDVKNWGLQHSKGRAQLPAWCTC